MKNKNHFITADLRSVPYDCNGEHHMRSRRIVVHISTDYRSVRISKSQEIKYILIVELVVRNEKVKNEKGKNKGVRNEIVSDKKLKTGRV